jgi:hypothetical protein
MTRNPPEFVENLASRFHNRYHKGDWNNCKHELCKMARQWVALFDEEDDTWVTADRQLISIKKMDDAHLINSYRLVRKKASSEMIILQNELNNKSLVREIIYKKFPMFGILKAEILRRESISNIKYNSTRNLDL